MNIKRIWQKPEKSAGRILEGISGRWYKGISGTISEGTKKDFLKESLEQRNFSWNPRCSLEMNS